MHAKRKAALGDGPDAAQGNAFVPTTYHKPSRTANDLDDAGLPDSWQRLDEVVARMIARLRPDEP
jgi:hypothetical protein